MKDVKLTNRDLSNWKSFGSISNQDAMGTMDKFFQWYDGYLGKYGRQEAPAEYDRFKSSVDGLRGLYNDSKRDNVLDPQERQSLTAAANQTDVNLTHLMERADLPTSARNVTDAQAKPAKSSAETAPVSKTETTAPSKAGPTETAPAFDGQYRSVAEDALDSVKKGEATLGLGDKGPAIQQAQEQMLKHGASFTKTDASGRVVKDYGADGFMGDVTKRELEKLQDNWGIPKTGRLDAKTLERLNAEPTKGDVPAQKAEAASEAKVEAARAAGAGSEASTQRTMSVDASSNHIDPTTLERAKRQDPAAIAKLQSNAGFEFSLDGKTNYELRARGTVNDGSFLGGERSAADTETYRHTTSTQSGNGRAVNSASTEKHTNLQLSVQDPNGKVTMLDYEPDGSGAMRFTPDENGAFKVGNHTFAAGSTLRGHYLENGIGGNNLGQFKLDVIESRAGSQEGVDPSYMDLLTEPAPQSKVKPILA